MLADEPISKIMTTPVTTASKIAPFSIIKQIFQQQSFHHVPIIHENKVIGMITSTDIIKAGHLEDLNSHDPQVDTILDHAVLIENLMQKKSFNHSKSCVYSRSSQCFYPASFSRTAGC
jgi:CBS domain-containing membrane protein